jgi:hypothetical protein
MFKQPINYRPDDVFTVSRDSGSVGMGAERLQTAKPSGVFFSFNCGGACHCELGRAEAFD